MIQHLLLLIAFALAAVAHRPSLLLRSPWIARLSERAGIQWQDLRIEDRPRGFFTPEIHILWNGAHVRRPDLQADVRRGELKLVVNFLHFPPQVTELGPVELDVDRLNLKSAGKPEPQARKKDSGSGFQVPTWVRDASLEDIHVHVGKFNTAEDSGSLDLKHVHGSDRWVFRADEAAHQLELTVAGENKSHSINGTWTFQVDAMAKKISPGTPELKEVRLDACRIDFEKGKSTDRLKTDCPLSAKIHSPLAEGQRTIEPNERFRFKLVSDLSSEDFFDARRKVRGDLTLQLLPVDPLVRPKGILKSWGVARVSGEGTPSRPTNQWNVRSELDFQLAIQRFQDLVRLLDPTKYAIPAPLHALSGNFIFSVRGDLTPDRAEAPVHLATRLSSPHQNFDLDLNGKLLVHQFRPSMRGELDGTLVLTNVRIPLPHIDYKALPRITPDPRIHPGGPKRLARDQEKQAAGAIPAFEYHLKVVTQQQPVQIVSNLTPAPVPVRLNVALDSGSPVTGAVHVDSFPLDLFHRNARVDHVDLDLTPKEQKLSGSVHVAYTDYTIQALLFGTLSEPGIKFLSDPPLSDQDVISVLLFGRTSEDLDSGENQSVGNVRSAVANRTLDLASLYLLASTPVESVGYDPQSGAVSVKFKLAAGTSLNIAGAQQELQSIGIRERLGRNWAVTTQYGNPADPTDRSVSTYLEWSHRY